MANGPQYSIIFQNNSVNSGDVCIYQQDPDTNIPGVMSLAWFAKRANPTTSVKFSWQVEYDFVWAQTGNLAPGVVFSASQVWPADLQTSNQVTFTKENGAYTFTDQRQGAQAGSLSITESGNIPSNMASVGIGMSGSGTFAVQAQPNMQVMFTPRPQYWITFGNYIEGQTLDVSTVFNPAKIDFPVNIYTMVATLNADNTWTIEPVDTFNAKYLEAKKQNPEVLWGVA